ncbi:hypothetical protein C8R45DRAFT_1161869 [Mycena sanguinolenta]|nr:hypothetical protein C8R45DRAFT_1161869 [Mycena sanguinolenta]
MSVVAAYPGVGHTLAGVTSGYRLSLVYNIVTAHVGDRPTLPEIQGQKLRHILRSWKQMSPEEAPTLLASLFQHNYCLNNFSAQSLAGSDELLLSYLHPLARALKFRMYLAHVKATVSRRFVVTKIVDLRGMPVAVDLDLQSEDLLNGSITDQDLDDETFDWFNHDYSFHRGTRTRICRRTVLLIWPKGSDTDLSVSLGDIYDYACDALRRSLSTRRNEANLKTTVQVLRQSADRWNDPQILLRTLKACGVDKNTDIMGLEGFVSAYHTFGWDVLKDFYGQAMANDESNARRHALLARLTQIGAEENAEVSSWCKDQADRVLRSLSKVDVAQIPWLLDLGVSQGGEFLRDVILPQLCAQNLDTRFWLSFAQRIKQNIGAIHTTFPDVVLILECVTQAVRNLPAFLTHITQTAPAFWYIPQEKSSDAILEVIKLCVDTKNEALCGEIFTKMRETARPRPWLCYADLSPSLIEYTQGKPALDAIFKPFFVDVIDVMVSGARHSSDGKSITLCPFTDDHKSIMVNAARKVGGITILKERMTAARLKGHDSSTIQALVRTIVETFPRQELQESVPQQAYDELITTLVRLAISTFDPSLSRKNLRQPHYKHSADQMIGMIKFCFEVGAEKQCKRLLLRFVSLPSSSTVGEHVSKVLAPFISLLRPFLLSNSLNFQIEPYRMFAAAVVKAFAEQVIGQKPTEAVSAALRQAVGCQDCGECHELRTFFLSDEPIIRLSRAQPIRTHLESELGKTSSWGVTWKTIRSGSPHTLLVTKPPSMTSVARWRANSKAGKTLLQDLGDAATQARILGVAYSTVYAQIHGEEAPPVHHGPMPVVNASHAPKRAATGFPAAPSVPKKPRLS